MWTPSQTTSLPGHITWMPTKSKTIILVCGLPGAGKTTFARALVAELTDAVHLNVGMMRLMANDVDFSDAGRLRSARRSRAQADQSNNSVVVIDSVCALARGRDIIKPDLTIFMDTISAGRFEDTNQIFERPQPHGFLKTWDHGRLRYAPREDHPLSTEPLVLSIMHW